MKIAPVGLDTEIALLRVKKEKKKKLRKVKYVALSASLPSGLKRLRINHTKQQMHHLLKCQNVGAKHTVCSLTLKWGSGLPQPPTFYAHGTDIKYDGTHMCVIETRNNT